MSSTHSERTAQNRCIGLVLILAILFMHASLAWADRAEPVFGGTNTAYTSTDNRQAPIVTHDSAFSWLKVSKALLPTQPAKQVQYSFFYILSDSSSPEGKTQFLESALPVLPILLPAVCLQGMMPDVLAPPAFVLL